VRIVVEYARDVPDCFFIGQDAVCNVAFVIWKQQFVQLLQGASEEIGAVKCLKMGDELASLRS
jgi:hypothetical protein